MRTQTSVDNTINDLRYEIKFETCVKDKITFLVKETLFFFLEQKCILSWRNIFFKIPKNLVTSAFTLPYQILKKRNASAKASNGTLVQLTD